MNYKYISLVVSKLSIFFCCMIFLNCIDLRNVAYDLVIVPQKLNAMVVHVLRPDNIHNSLTSDLSSEIKSSKLNDFNDTIDELLELKFPYFLVEDLKKESTLVMYEFLDEYLFVKYSKHSYVDYKQIYTLKVYYNEIKDCLINEHYITKNYVNENGFDYDPDKISVALTFDDGPHGVYTNNIIDELDNYKSRATFFMLGLSMEGNTDIIKNVYESGNSIGVHGYSHKSFKSMSISEMKKELSMANDLLYNVTGEYTTLFRPPYGSYNSTVTKNLEYSFILWNLDTNDWRYQEKDYLYNHVIENAKDGDIILFHDIFESTSDALGDILKELYLMDIQVVDIETLADLKGMTLEKKESYFKIN